ncbi:MAG: LacI family DNA-binding transcriptional regulator [Actinobacteria bacterium]|nr:LacI family DNA-binding transcriptional regulator [Actinomycetota bacterium]
MAGSRPQRTRIQDVAKAAGVSPTTVSHALNGRGKVSPETRKLVADAARRLRYQPSRAARSLRTARTETLGLVLPAFETTVPADLQTVALDHYMQLTRSAALTAFDRGYRLLLAPRLTSSAEIDALGVDGAIICDPVADDHQIDFFAGAEIPVVTYEQPPNRPEFRWHVHSDNRANIHALLDHLADSGGTSIAFVIPDLPSPTIDEIRTAYSDWCADHDTEQRLAIVRGQPERTVAKREVEALLRSADPPDAILDVVPPSSLQACRQLGLRVPDDVLIASFIDTAETRSADPPITAIDLNPVEIGRRAVDLLVDLVEGGSPDGPVIVPSPLRIRASSRRG